MLSSVLIGAGTGFLTGVSVNIIEQGSKSDWDFSKIDPMLSIKNGLKEATIGAITSVFTFGMGQLGNKIGQTIGYHLSKK